MQAAIVLTVAQGKRLIARAVAQMPEVKRAMNFGMVAIGRGTTNGYVAEELLGYAIPKGEYVAGRTLPPDTPSERLGTGKYPDIVLKQGAPLDGVSIAQAVGQMGAGDVFIKGGNALNYQTKEVGVLIGNPVGGTTGVMYGTVIARKIHLILPIGLEKLVYADIAALSRQSRTPEGYASAPAPALFPVTGAVVTEIEALQMLCGVHATLYSAGGVGGAEGAIWLLLDGAKEELDRALAVYNELKSEQNLALLPAQK